MDNRKMIDNPNRYISEKEYFEGYVCFIDVMGFKKYVLEHPYTDVKNMFNANLNGAINFDSNFNEIKFCFLSDSILITIRKKDILDLSSQIKSLVALCCTFREIVFERLQLDIRASITYGEYMQSGPSNVIIFGPAIIRAHTLAERINEIPDSEIPRIIKYGRSASIIIDKKVFQSDPNNILIDDYISDNVVLKTGYVLVNPFLEPFLWKNDKTLRCKDYLCFWKNVTKEYKPKYKNAKNFALLTLHNTVEKKKKLFGEEVCSTIDDIIILNRNIRGPF